MSELRASVISRETVDGAVSLIASRFLKQLVAWLLEISLVRFLAPEIWEAASRFLTFSLASSVILQFGFPESLLSLGARCDDHVQAKRMLLRASALLILLSLVFTLALAPFGALRERILGSADLAVLGWFGLLLGAELVAGAIPAFLVGRRFQRQAALYGTLARLPTLLGALLAVLWSSSLSSVTCLMALGSCLSAWVGLLLCEKLAPGGQHTQPPFNLLAQLRYAAPVGLTRVAQMLNSQLDKLVVLATLPQAAFGTYYLGAVEVQFVPMICQTLTSVLMPEFARSADREDFRELFHASVRKMLLLAMPCFAFLFAFAELSLVAVYGEAHRAAVVPFQIFQLLLLHRFTNYALIFQALGKPHVPFVAALIMLALNAPLSLLLSRHFGATGAALATVSSLYLSTIYTFISLRRALGGPWSRLLPFRAYVLTLLVALLSLAPALAVATWLPQDLTTLSVTLGTYLVTYFLLGRVAGVISSSDAGFVSDMARLRFLWAKHSA